MKKAVEQIDPIQDTAMVVEQFKFVSPGLLLFEFSFHVHVNQQVGFVIAACGRAYFLN